LKVIAEGIINNQIVGFQPLFINLGWDWIWWEEICISAYKVFDEVQPDLFVGVGEPSKALSQCLKEFDTPSIIQTAPFTYKVGKKIFKYACLVDHFTYNNNRERCDKLRCDIGCFTINKTPSLYLTSLCYPIDKYQIIILGSQRWNLPQYLGDCNIEEKILLYRSSNLIFCETIEEKARSIACNNIAIEPSSNLNLSTYNIAIKTVLKNTNNYEKAKNQQKQWYKDTVKTYEDILPEILDELNI